MNDYHSLLLAARNASNSAYSPYSNYKIGAAVLCSDGTIVTGCNIENKSFGLTICAERVAIFNAISNSLKPTKIALSGMVQNKWATPCGACRQVMAEFFSNDTMIMIDGHGLISLSQLLPYQF